MSKINIITSDSRKKDIVAEIEISNFQLACDVDAALLSYYGQIRRVEKEKYLSDFRYSITLYDDNGDFASGYSCLAKD